MAAGVLIAQPLNSHDNQSQSWLQNWPQWRGPHSNGIAAAGDYPIEFSSEKKVVWKTKLPGVGSSTPAVWGEQIFVTCGIDGQDGVVCYNWQGKEQWREQLGTEVPGKHRNGSGSNPSPVTDGKHLVVYYKSGTVACLDLLGEVRWQCNLQETFDKIEMWWDTGTSPVLIGDRVVIAVMHAGNSYLVALDLESGKILWKELRSYDRPKESDQAYTTPQVVRLGGRDQIITWGADHLTAHDVETGELFWEIGGFNPDEQAMWRVIASAAIGDGVAVVPYGRGEFLGAVRMDELHGAAPLETDWLWKKEGLGADVPTPLIDSQRVYLLGDKGVVTCLDLQTGKQFWASEKLGKRRAKFYASPILAGDLLYCASDDGVICVSRISNKGLQQLAMNDMGESVIATPIPIRNGLLVRSIDHLFWIQSQQAATE